MPTAEMGPTGDVVRENIRQLRGRMSLRDLEARLREIGRPIRATSLLKLERGERRVDVDDLVALAAVFGVPPGRLLEPIEQSEPLTAAQRDTHRDVIDAAVGAVREAVERGLPRHGVIDYIDVAAGPIAEYEAAGRPDWALIHEEAYEHGEKVHEKFHRANDRRRAEPPPPATKRTQRKQRES